MPYEIDHLFICASIGSPEAEQLIEFGLTEGLANVHPGQGTANRRFFFHNGMLELLWVKDEMEAKSERTSRTYLWERWSGRLADACPFGVCIRPTAGTTAPPFAAWEYHPEYLPEHVHIDMAANTHKILEPMLFFLAFAKRRVLPATVKPEPIRHASGLRELTRVGITAPQGAGHSEELMAILDLGLLTMRAGSEYLMEIGFDGEVQGLKKDFRPFLPLVFSW